MERFRGYAGPAVMWALGMAVGHSLFDGWSWDTLW